MPRTYELRTWVRVRDRDRVGVGVGVRVRVRVSYELRTVPIMWKWIG